MATVQLERWAELGFSEPKYATQWFTYSELQAVQT